MATAATISVKEEATAAPGMATIPAPTVKTVATPAGTVAYGHKFSTVVPGTPTAEGVERGLSGIDLVLRLHYIRGVYLYEASHVVAELDTPSLKAPLFTLLEAYYPVCGRVRVGSKIDDKTVLKCNDCGVRIVEAKSEMQIHQLTSNLSGSGPHSRLLIESLEPQQVVGPQLQFSPLLIIQFTRFKCGGLAVGFSWSHILGDAVSAACFLNAWAKLIAIGKQLLRLKKPEVDLEDNSELQPSHGVVDSDLHPAPASSVKQIYITDGRWLVPPQQNKIMESFIFRITDAKLGDLRGKMGNAVGEFEAICAVIWKCVAGIRSEDDGSVITICRPSPTGKNTSNQYLGNRQKISTARYSSVPPAHSVANANLSELARLVAGEGARDETQAIKDNVVAYNVDDGNDVHQRYFVLYGGNLTFVDMGQVECYGLKLKGQAPVLVNYNLFGVGDAGAVVVLPGLLGQDGGDGGGRLVNVTLSTDEIPGLRQELSRGGFFGH